MTPQNNRDVFTVTNQIKQVNRHRTKLEALLIPSAVRVAAAIINALPPDTDTLPMKYRIDRPEGKSPVLKRQEWAIETDMGLWLAYAFAQEVPQLIQELLSRARTNQIRTRTALQSLSAINRSLPQLSEVK